VLIDPTNSVIEVRSFGNTGNILSSGFLIRDGIVITTSHSIGDPTSELFVSVPEIGEFSSELLAIDQNIDTAVLKITTSAEDLPYLKLSNSYNLKIGQEVLTNTSKGKITNLNSAISAAQSLLVKNFSELIQFDANIKSGSSGGPLLNTNNEVIGIITVQTPNDDELNFAVPINIVKKFLEEESIEF